MALDTQNKRASALGVANPHHAYVFPNPDGTIDQPDRQQIAYAYPGIAAAGPTSGIPQLALTGVGM